MHYNVPEGDDAMKTDRKPQAGLLIFLCWLVYTASYLGKVNYSANITRIMDFYGVTKTQAGAVPTFFFFSYGVGQVINGLLCKKYPMKQMIFGSLLVSAAINLTIAVTANFAIIKWLWLLNGITLSVLWPGLVRLLSENLPHEALGKSSVIMGTTVAGGTLVIYALSALYAAFGSFKAAFYTAALKLPPWRSCGCCSSKKLWPPAGSGRQSPKRRLRRRSRLCRGIGARRFWPPSSACASAPRW